jgi:hypothetical protein
MIIGVSGKIGHPGGVSTESIQSFFYVISILLVACPSERAALKAKINKITIVKGVIS